VPDLLEAAEPAKLIREHGGRHFRNATQHLLCIDDRWQLLGRPRVLF
jgi:hypothetical protein